MLRVVDGFSSDLVPNCSTFLSWLFRLTSWISLTSLFAAGGADAIKCFCTSRICNANVCEGISCLIGYKGAELVQSCGTASARALANCARNLNEWDRLCSCSDEDYCNTLQNEQRLMKKYDAFRQIDPTAPEAFAGMDMSNVEDKDARGVDGKTTSTKHLVLLLVVVPLGIGALTVCLIFLNYHCKMC